MTDTPPTADSERQPPSKRGKNTGSVWPRLYLLSIYNAAVDEGHLLIRPISEEKAQSLSKSLMNQRRSSTASAAQFIREEFHMVTVGQWTPDNGGTLPILYSTIPDLELPSINTLDGRTISLQPPKKPRVPATGPAPSALSAPSAAGEKIPLTPVDELEIENMDPADWVQRMVAESHSDDQENDCG